jgi:LuxR family maltose regulon positive regulatory protein
MATHLLATKLSIPPVRETRTVVRPELLAHLTVGRDGKLTLISAPAGFGKTTLVAAWLATSDSSACWLSLDAGDSDPFRFLTYVVAALQTIAPHIGTSIAPLLEAPQPPPLDALLTPLLNDIATLPHDVVLVLDDYHVLDSPEIDAALAFFIDHQPPQLHLVITTREDPPLPLPRLRARGDLTELRMADLRFTPAEADALLNQRLGLGLSAEAVALIAARTEGWIAGLHMAALSLVGRADIDVFLQSFTGSHRFILDYLVEEVVQRQPERVREFLLQTAMLERLTAPLCDAVTGRDDSQALLERLERSNMLIVPLDDQRRWYRYHQLFAEVLQAHAQQATPEQVPIWQQRASVWYEQNGVRTDAIRYAFAAGNLERVAALIERTWPELFYGVRPMVWLGWAQQLPDTMVRVRPVVCAGCAWMLLDKGELETAEAFLNDVEAWLDAAASGRAAATQSGMVVANATEFRALPGSTAAARAYLAQAQGDVSGTIHHARRALTLLAEQDHFWRGNAALFLGLAQWASGDLAAAYGSMTASVTHQRQAGSHYFETFGMVALADIRMAQGRLHDAHRHYEQALQRVSAGTPDQDTQVIQGPVALYAGLGDLFREWGDLDTAAQYLAAGQEVVARAVLPGNAYRLSCALARLSAAQGDLDGALDHLAEAERRYQRAAVPDVAPIAAIRARVWLRQGRWHAALGWAHQRGLTVDDDLTFLNEYEYLTFARILIAAAQHQPGATALHAAITLLERLLHAAEAGGRSGTVIEAASLHALAHQAQDELATALMWLSRALALAEPAGSMQVFVDAGPALVPLLARSLSRGTHPAFVRQLLARIHPQHGDASTTVEPNQLLIEPLSQRERAVLSLLAQGCSNQAIADELVIAVSTVKKHVNNIFGKLGVANRTQAINRARELDLLA